MKNKLLFLATLIFYFLTETISAQSPNWQWAKSAGGTTGNDYGNSVSTDAGGNVYMTGSFGSPSITIGTTTLTNAGYRNIFILKYDASGTVLWAKSAGGTNNDYGIGIASDAGGNVYVTGRFGSSSITFGTTTLTNAGYDNMFIVKYDASGTVLWAKSAAGTESDVGNSISTDAGGNVYVTGNFRSPSITFGTTTLTNAGADDMFIAKYDSSGTVLWAKSAGGTYNDPGIGVATDAGENVYMTGCFNSPSITFGTTTLTNANAGYNDMYIAKYDSSGTVLWAKSTGGTGHDYGYSVSTDAGGNAYVTGVFANSSIIFGTTTLTNAGGDDMFIVKYDALGTVLWAKSAGGTDPDDGYGVSADAGGNVYVTGYFGSPSITFGTTTLTNAGADNMFIAKYDASGTVQWAKSAGGIFFDFGIGISTDAGGNVYVTGYFGSPSITFGTTTLTNAGGYNMFLAKLDTVIITENNEIENFKKGIYLYPNPASNSTTISFSLSQSQNVSLKIFDVNGRLVSILADKFFEAGENELVWNAAEVNAGIYILQFQSTENLLTKKLIVTKP